MKPNIKNHIKKIKDNYYELTSDYLSLDVNPILANILLQKKKRDLNDLLDEKIKILVITNQKDCVMEFFSEDFEHAHINSEIQPLSYYLQTNVFRKEYYDYIIITHNDRDSFRAEDLFLILKQFSCPILISKYNEKLISVIKKG